MAKPKTAGTGSNQYAQKATAKPAPSPTALVHQAASRPSTLIDHNAERHRSYDIRRAVLGDIHRDGSGYAITAREISSHTPEHPQHTTTDAGWRGIEASATAPDGTEVHGVSLGAFTPDLQQQYIQTCPREIRLEAARYPTCPLPTLKILLTDEDNEVRETAAAHPLLPRSILAMWQLANSSPQNNTPAP